MVTQRSVAVVLAAGSGERFGQDLPKQFVKIAGRSILEHTVLVFERSPVDEIIIVVSPQHRSLAEQIVVGSGFRKVTRILNGGASRRESSRIGLQAVQGDDTKVLVHDSVRPFLSQRIIEECLAALDRYEAVDVAIPSPDTIIEVDEQSLIRTIPERRRMMRGQTPQAFRAGLLRRAHALADAHPDAQFTDDCGMVVRFKLADVQVVKGEERNLKITYPEDVFLADKLFQLGAMDASVQEVPAESLRNRVLVVFGATRGIGEAICRLAVEAGARVHGFARSSGVDVRDGEAVRASLQTVAEREGQINYVVNTAGVLRMGKIEARPFTDIREEIEINYLGAVNVLREALPYLRGSRGSLLLFTSSSYTRGRALYSIYSSTKAAIVNLAQACSEECYSDGVRVNVINPERTATPMRYQNFGLEPEDSLLTAEQVAKASLSALTADITGHVLYVKK